MIPSWASEFFNRLQGVKEKKPNDWMALCPAHDDHTPSLSITMKDGRLLLCCFSGGCRQDAILRAIGLDWKALVPPTTPDDAGLPRNGRSASKGRLVKTYDYCDETGRLLYQVCRYEPGKNGKSKDFSQRRPTDDPEKWIPSIKDVRRVLYRLPCLMTAIAHRQMIFLCEGEKDADNLAALDLAATTCAQGATKWRPEYTEALRGADVIVLPDNDASGKKDRDIKCVALHGIAARVRVLELPGLPPKGDVSDWLQSGGTAEELLRLAAEAPDWIPPAVPDRHDEQPDGRNLTDLGNAERLVDQHGNDIRYCVTWSQWLIWNGRHWQIDETGEIQRRAKQTIRSIYQEAANCADGSRRGELARHAVASETASRVAAMILLARFEDGIPVAADSLDTDHFLLCCENGTLDLKTGKLRPHRREDLITKSVAAPYDPSATCPHWHAHLDRFIPDAEVKSFLQRAVGYTLTGDVSERVCFIMHGTGSNGKSVLIETLAHLMGRYAMRTPVETLMARRDGAIPNDVARLKGARLVHASETEEGKRLAEAFIKEITGGDTVSARFMRGEWFDFKPELKLWLRTNYKPVIRGTDQAIWDRLPLIPFNVRIPEEEKRPLRDVMDELRSEMAGILAWAVKGCQDWLRGGLAMPDEVKAATENYRSEMDTFGNFLEECCVIGKQYEVNSSLLYDAFKTWCEANGEHCSSQKWLGGRLTMRGFDRHKRSGAFWWGGLGLLDTKGPSGPSGPKIGISSHLDSHESVIGKNHPDGPDGPLEDRLNMSDPFEGES